MKPPRRNLTWDRRRRIRTAINKITMMKDEELALKIRQGRVNNSKHQVLIDFGHATMAYENVAMLKFVSLSDKVKLLFRLLGIETLIEMHYGRTQALESFEGIERRFEEKGHAAGVRVVDDYGHQPAEMVE